MQRSFARSLARLSLARSLARESRSSFPCFLSSSFPPSQSVKCVAQPEALFTSPTPLACRRRAYLGRSQPASALVSSSSDLSSPDSFLGVAHPPLHHAVNRRPIHPIFLAPLPTMLVRSCHCFVTVQVWMAIDAAFPTTLYCSSLATSPAQSFSFLRRPIPLQGPVARFDFGAATLRCALACERRAWGGGVLVRDNDGIGACGRFELRTPTPIEQGVFCIPLVAFRLLGRRIRRRQGTYRRAFLASTRAAQIAEHIYMKRGHAYADEEEDEGEASLFNGLPSSGAAPMSMLTHPSSVSRLWSHTHWWPSRRSQWVS